MHSSLIEHNDFYIRQIRFDFGGILRIDMPFLLSLLRWFAKSNNTARRERKTVSTRSTSMLCLKEISAGFELTFFVLQKDCPSGKLNKKKFIEVYKQFYPTGKAEKFCEYVFRTFDTDNSSSIGNVAFLFITASQERKLIRRLKKRKWNEINLVLFLSLEKKKECQKKDRKSFRTNMQFIMQKFIGIEHVKHTRLEGTTFSKG